MRRDFYGIRLDPGAYGARIAPARMRRDFYGIRLNPGAYGARIVAAFLLFFCLPLGYAGEVFQETHTKVIVREHPKTGRPYVSIVPSEVPDPPDPFAVRRKYARPDYRMLDAKIKSGKIPYDGPYSDRKKIYLFAAGLATLGVAGGVVGMAVAPAAAGAGASGGAGIYAAAGSAVAAGTAGTIAVKSKPDPQKDNFSRTAESRREAIL